MDRALDEGLRRFQQDRKLKVDGLATPGGETEAALNASLSGSLPADLPADLPRGGLFTHLAPETEPAPETAPETARPARDRDPAHRTGRPASAAATPQPPRAPRPGAQPATQEDPPLPITPAQLLGALVTGKLPPLPARPAFPPQIPAPQIPAQQPAAQAAARRPATPAPAPAVDPGDAQAVHEVLTRQGYRYKPDPFGRIGP